MTSLEVQLPQAVSAGMAARGEHLYAAKPSSRVRVVLALVLLLSALYMGRELDPSGRTQRALAVVDSHNVNLVVVNHRPPFAGPIAA
ncbi:MAG: hypothetical protein WB683_05660 [Candidatus Sulfotelmatobacter sp.]